MALLSSVSVLTVSRLHYQRLKLRNSQNIIRRCNLPCSSSGRLTVCCSNTSQWEPAPVTYASDNEETLPKENGNIFESMTSSSEPNEALMTKTEQNVDTSNRPVMSFKYLKWPLWIIGPALLLITGVVPTLWLPVQSIFLGPTIASLLALTGLDCVFNLGASLFLLMADSSARSNDLPRGFCKTRPPPSYQFWNTVANVAGFMVPMAMLVGSQKGFVQPQMPFISFAVLLGPYFLLLLVQMLTEMLTWHWESPVWLVTPVVYEGYRLVQLMRGLKLGVELVAPSWMMNMVRGLVCCWVLVLGVQLMRVAWYAGFTARAFRQQSDGPTDG